MSKRVVLHRHGGPEVLEFADTQLGDPGPGEVRLRHSAIGLNFIDTYHRSGLYPLKLPSGLGMEGAGRVVTVGPDVRDFQIGDRVAYAAGELDAYSEERLCRAEHLVPIPESVSDEVAAAMLLKGMTAYYLLFLTFAVGPGHRLLVHAAAGGVGSLLVPWARHLGATVIGTARGAEKQAAARTSGCALVLDADDADFVEQVRTFTGGEGVDVVYDSVGKASWDSSLACLKRRGLMVSYGNASGKVPAFEPALLSAKGSLFLTRPTLGHYTHTRAELLNTAAQAFEALNRGIVHADIRQRYPLREAARAHRDLESRALRGLSVLLP
jgi:NADPH2:quinone reductase